MNHLSHMLFFFGSKCLKQFYRSTNFVSPAGNLFSSSLPFNSPKILCGFKELNSKQLGFVSLWL